MIAKEPAIHTLSSDVKDYKIVDYGLLNAKRKYYPRMRITSSQNAAEYIKAIPMVQSTLGVQEIFGILHMNRNNYAVGFNIVSMGGLSGTVVDPKLVFKMALDMMSSGIILWHNHPSGNEKPSEADISLVKKLQASGQMLDIAVLDSLIITENKYISFSDEGLI